MLYRIYNVEYPFSKEAKYGRNEKNGRINTNDAAIHGDKKPVYGLYPVLPIGRFL
jgi:hypothetical protein